MPCVDSRIRRNTSAAAAVTSAADANMSNLDEFTGVLEVVRQKQPQKGQKVFVVIHRTTTEHFAAIYPLRLLPCAQKALATINLKASVIKKLDDNSLRIQPKKDIDGISLTLRVPERESVSKWLLALSSHDDTLDNCCVEGTRRKSGSHRGISLPPLLEDVEA